jgi:di/tricarboxylate transporter
MMGFVNPIGFMLLEIKREKVSLTDLDDYEKLQAGDILVFSAGKEAIIDLWGTEGLEPIHGSRVREISAERFSHRLIEVVVSRRSTAIGRKIKEFPLRKDEVKGAIVGISREGQPVEGAMSQVRIKAGDIGVLEVDEPFFHHNLQEVEFAMVRRLTGARIKRYDRAITASSITIAMVVVVSFGWMSMLNAALLATGAMIATGCLTLSAAGRSVDFKTLTIIASAIGLEAAVTGSGLSDAAADLLTRIGGNNPYIALTVVFLGCIIMDTMITNVASAVFMFPIAMAMAANLGVNGMPFAIIVMVGASSSFISPMGYQTNLMVYGPGRYKFTDFVKIGIPMTFVVGVITIFLAPIIWPF